MKIGKKKCIHKSACWWIWNEKQLGTFYYMNGELYPFENVYDKPFIFLLKKV